MVNTEMQGTLDGFCGIYSIVNACNLALKENKSKEITEFILANIQGNVLKRYMLQGMTIDELIPILRKTTKKFGLKYERLNYERKGRFIKLAKHSDPVIVGIIGNNKIWGEDGHWTVIRKVTNKKVKIQDSSIYARDIPRKRFPQFEQTEVVRVYKP